MIKKKHNTSNRRMSFKERQTAHNEQTVRKLSKFQNLLSYGFSDSNFKKATELYLELQDRIYPTEREALGEVWRNVYTNSNSYNAIEEQVSAIKARFLTDDNSQ